MYDGIINSSEPARRMLETVSDSCDLDLCSIMNSMASSSNSTVVDHSIPDTSVAQPLLYGYAMAVWTAMQVWIDTMPNANAIQYISRPVSQ
jgi:hypothetical protein